MAMLKLRATADPSSVLFAASGLTVRTDARGNVIAETTLKVHTWLDDEASDMQLFAVGDDCDAWPLNQGPNTDINHVVIRDRLRVLELRVRKSKSYVIATSAEMGPANEQ